MLLTQMLDAGHVNFKERCADWQSAIRAGCEPLVASGAVDAAYADEIIASIEQYGPYIVIAPDIAMPHAQGNTASVHQTAVSFMKVHEAVALFFTLASQNHEQHLENMSMLATMLDNEALIAELLTAQSNDDLRNIAAKYGI